MAFSNEDHKVTVAVIRALKEGHGVEDIAVRRIAGPEYTRRVIARLRAGGLLCGVLGVQEVG